MYYKKSALLQSGAGITNWGNRYYKVGQVLLVLLSGATLLQNAETITEKASTYS